MSIALRQSAGRSFAAYRTVPLTAPADLLRLHELNPARYPHLLESTARHPRQGRYDILFAFPGDTLVCDAEGRSHCNSAPVAGAGFLAALEATWRSERTEPAPDAPPFRGGWFVFLGYEMLAEIEPGAAGIRLAARLPRALATRFPAAFIRDHAQGISYAVVEADQAHLIPSLLNDARAAAASETDAPPRCALSLEEEPAERFLDAVDRIKAYIAAGDVFQVNLSRLWRGTLDRGWSDAHIFRQLRAANPAPFSALATLGGGLAILSSSPERLVELRGGAVRTRPIAGTYPRSADPAQDRQWSQELLRHPKERAEHIMLIDLERNDLGRVCRPGSVRVGELMTLESYRHVHHIVSEVSGELVEDVSPVDVLRAVFPGGTITGCPKVRCMQIIAELERAPRGAYTGSLGYLNRDGSMDFNILIRTLTRCGEEISFRAGAGIVADSEPARELAETRAKAKGLAAALSAA